MAHERQRIAFEEFSTHVQQVFDQVKEQNQPVLVEREGETYVVMKQQSRPPVRRRHQPTSANDPVWHLIHLTDGLDLPQGPGDVSENIDAYLAEAYLPNGRWSESDQNSSQLPMSSARRLSSSSMTTKSSLTDATSFVVMERLEIAQAFTFDRNFRQYGIPPLLPPP